MANEARGFPAVTVVGLDDGQWLTPLTEQPNGVVHLAVTSTPGGSLQATAHGLSPNHATTRLTLSRPRPWPILALAKLILEKRLFFIFVGRMAPGGATIPSTRRYPTTGDHDIAVPATGIFKQVEGVQSLGTISCTFSQYDHVSKQDGTYKTTHL